MLGSKKKQLKKSRSRSQSLSLSRSKKVVPDKQVKKNAPKTSRVNIKNRSPVNPSLSKSQSKKGLGKSGSQKKVNRSVSKSRIVSSPGPKPVAKKDRKELERSVSKDKAKTKESRNAAQEAPSNTIRSDEREMGLNFVRPEHDKIVFKSLEITDPVFDKYLDMINNDNDANYVMNALPELGNFRKENESEGRDFVSGRISRLSGIFENLSVDKIITLSRKVPHYYSGQCGKNLSLLKIVLQTKFKVEVDLGFLQYSLDGDKLTVFRIYVSKIYRRMNYLGFIYLESLKGLIGKHPGADRWAIFILEKNVNVHKFFKYLGFHIEKIATESKNKTVDYFQEFMIKKKDLSTVLATMTK
jgi:hypothetical protein